MGYPTVDYSIAVTSGGTSQKINTTTGASAQSDALFSNSCYIFSTSDIFIRQGSNPTAVATGIDQFIPGGVPMRLFDIVLGYKLAFINVTTNGTVYITPGV